MLIIGAGGHASEIIDELYNGSQEKQYYFFDEISMNQVFLNEFKVLRNTAEVYSHCNDNFQFVLGVGNPLNRKNLANRFCKLGGKQTGVISLKANVSQFKVHLENGVDVMTNASISSNVTIGKGTLINRNASIHHDCVIGEFCEIAPNAVLLGKVKVGELSFIGAGAIILPGITIGSNCVIAAGSVVTRDVADNQIVKGIPAK